MKAIDLCTPVVPLRCWRYDPDAEQIPSWVLEFIHHNGTGLSFQPRDEEIVLEAGDVIVQLPTHDLPAMYSAEEFAKHFRAVP